VLLPVGHDLATLRRLPWVTFSIMAACTLAWLLTALVPRASGGPALGRAERAAVEYALDRPYLHLSSELKGATWLALRQQQRPSVERPDPATVRVEQGELDRLTEAYRRLRDGQPYFRWGLVPARPHVAAFITHTFIHAGFLHLLGNMFFLYLVGPWVEDAWGRPLYAGFYFAAGVVAALTFIARHPTLDQPLIGASGAVAGVMGAFAVRFWSARVTFFYWLFFLKVYSGTFTAPAWVMLALWWLRELAYSQGLWAMAGIGDMGQVAFLAHVGGFAFGAAVAFAVRGLRLEERVISPAVERANVVHEAASVDQAFGLLRQGRHDEAADSLQALLEADPCDPDAALALWRVACATGRREELAVRLLPAITASARRSDPGLVTACWCEVLNVLGPDQVEPAVVVRIAELLADADLPGDASATLEWARPSVGSAAPVGLLVRLARLADRLAVVAPYARLALDHPELTPEGRIEMDMLEHRSSGSADSESRVGGDAPSKPASEIPARLRVVTARPLALTGDVLGLEVSGRRRGLRLDTIARCLGAIIAEAESRPYLILDLVLAEGRGEGGDLHIVRLTSRDADPCALVGGEDPVAAFGRLATTLCAGDGHVAPQPASDPRAWPRFAHLREYEGAVANGAVSTC